MTEVSEWKVVSSENVPMLRYGPVSTIRRDEVLAFQELQGAIARWIAAGSFPSISTTAPAANQVAVWEDPTTLRGYTALTFNGSDLVVNGNTVLDDGGGQTVGGTFTSTSTIYAQTFEVIDVNPDYRWNTTGTPAIGSIWDAVLLDADNSLRIRSWDATETAIEKQFIYTPSGDLQIPGAITTTGENTFTRGNGGVSLDLASDVSFTGTILYGPGIRWQEADGTAMAGIRGYVDTSDNKHLQLGYGWLNTVIDISSDGGIDITAEVTFAGDLLPSGSRNIGGSGNVWNQGWFTDLYVDNDRVGANADDFNNAVSIGHLDIASHTFSGTAYQRFYNSSWAGYYRFNTSSAGGEVEGATLYVNGSTPSSNYFEIYNGELRAASLDVSGSAAIDTITLGSNDVSTETDIQLTDNANIASTQSLNFFIDSDNNQTDAVFAWYHNAGATTGATMLMNLTEGGNLVNYTGGILAQNSYPYFELRDTLANTNEGRVRFVSDNDRLDIMALNDSGGFIANIFQSTRQVTTGTPDVPKVANGSGGTDTIIHAGGSQSKTGPFGITGGTFSVGVDDTTAGVINVYGPATGTEGGQINLFNSAVSDGTIEYWALDTNNGNFRIFPNTGSFVHAFNVDGSVSFGGGISTSGTLNTGGATVTSLATNGTTNLYSDNDGFQIGVQASDLYAYIAPVENGTPDYNKELQYVYADSRWRMEGEFNVTSNLLLGGRITAYQGAGAGQDGYALTWNNTSGYFEPTNVGGVTASGTPANNQLGVWVSATAIEGEPDVTYDGNELKLISDLAIRNSGDTLDVIKFNNNEDISVAPDIQFATSALIAAANSLYFNIDSDNNSTGQSFVWKHNAATSAGTNLMILGDDGSLTLSNGDLDINGNINVGGSGLGDSIIEFHDDNSNVERTFGWDDSENDWMFEDSSGGLDYFQDTMNIVLIESWTPTAVSSKNFVFTNHTDYAYILVVGRNISNTSDGATIRAYFGTSGGYASSANDYANRGLTVGGGTDINADAQFIQFSQAVGTANQEGLNFMLKLHGFGTTTKGMAGMEYSSAVSNQVATAGGLVGFGQTNNPVHDSNDWDRIQIQWSSGNFDANGNVSVYGVKG